MIGTLETQRRISKSLMGIATRYVVAAEKVEEIEKLSPDFASTDDTCNRFHTDPSWNYWVGRMGASYEALLALSSITSASEGARRDKVGYFIDAARMVRNAQ